MSTTTYPAEPLTKQEIRALNEEAESIIQRHALFATGAGLIPILGLDIIAVAGIQYSMISSLSNLYGVRFDDQKLRAGAITVIAAALPAVLSEGISALGRASSLFKTFASGLTGSALSGLVTAEVGQIMKRHFELGGTIDSLTFQEVYDYVAEQYQSGRFNPSTLTSFRGRYGYLFGR